MAEERTACPRCGAPLAASAAGRPCPACLMRLALGGGSDSLSFDRDDGAGRRSAETAALPAGTAPPSIDALAGLFPEMEILELIGRGGMGAVYLARQKSLDRLVALKIIRQDAAADPGFAERFAREARALARLNHPNVVTVHDFGDRRGLHYLVMEYVKGANVRQLLRAGKLDPQQALAIVPPVCDALQYAHEEGIVHRDIKPENLLVDERGRVKIADFGLAKLLRKSPVEVTLTADQQALGTFHYMAPEQLSRPLEVDHRADIYALGVTLYEMLTGELPVGRFALPSQKSLVDTRMDDVVLRAMEREPELRYQSAYEVKSDVVAYSSSHGFSSSVAAVPPPKFALPVSPRFATESHESREHILPSIFLVAIGVLSAIVQLLLIAALTFTTFGSGVDGPQIFLAIGFVAGLPVILGSLLAYFTRGYPMAVLGCVAALLPLGPAFPLMAPVGIWLLVVLLKPETRRAFATVAPGGPPAGQSDRLSSSARLGRDGNGTVEEVETEQQLVPGIALTFAGMLVVFFHVATFVAMFMNHRGPDGEIMVVFLGLALFGLPMILGGACCAKSRGYELAVFGALAAMLPISSCLPLTLPIGIWTLIVLRRPAVRAAFKRRREGAIAGPALPHASPDPKRAAAGETEVVDEYVLPGFGLIFAGLATFITHMAAVPLMLAEGDIDKYFFLPLLSAAFAVLTVVGGILCVNARGYGWAVAGALTAMLPISACVPLGLPIGIWALLTLRKQTVRATFAKRKEGARLAGAAPATTRSQGPNGNAIEAPSRDHVLPSMLLAACGVCGVVGSVALTWFLVVSDVGEPDWECFLPLFGIPFSVAMIVGGSLGATSRSIEMAWIGVFAAFLPFSITFWIGLPIAIWLALTLKRTDVQAMFAEQREERRRVRLATVAGADGTPDSFGAWWRGLPRALQLTAHVALALVYLFGMLSFFSFGGGSTRYNLGIGQREHAFAMGSPTPWLSLHDTPAGFDHELSFSWSLLAAAVGLAAFAAQRALTRLEGRPNETLLMHTAIWGALLAFAMGIGVSSLTLHWQIERGHGGDFPASIVPLVFGIVAGVAVLLGSIGGLLFNWLKKRRERASDPPQKPLPEADRQKQVFWSWTIVGLLVGFAAFGALAWFAIYQWVGNSGGDFGSGIVWRTPNESVTVASHNGIVRDVVVSRDGRFRVSIGDDGHVIWTDRQERETVRSYTVERDEGGAAPLRDVALSPDGHVAYVTGATGQSRILRIDLPTRRVEPLPIRRSGYFDGLAVSAGGEMISYVVSETAFEVTELTSFVTLATAEVFHGDEVEFGNVLRIAASPDGSLTAVTSSNLVAGKEPGVAARSAEPCQLSVFDRNAEEILDWRFPDYADFSYAQIAFLDDETLVAALPSGQLKSWTIRDGGWVEAPSVRISPGRYTAAAAGRDEKTLWLAHARQVALIDVANGEARAFADLSIGEKRIDDPKFGDIAAEPIEALAATDEPLTVVVGCWDGSVQSVTAQSLEIATQP